MHPSIKPGAAIRAKDNHMTRNCGIDPDNARGYICKADSAGISIYLTKTLGGSTIEAILTPEAFGANFMVDGSLLTPATYYIRSTHYTKVFPKDFL